MLLDSIFDWRHSFIWSNGQLHDLNFLLRGLSIFNAVLMAVFGHPYKENNMNAGPDFRLHSKVIGDYSEVLVRVFEEQGRHVQSVVGMNSCPPGMIV